MNGTEAADGAHGLRPDEVAFRDLVGRHGDHYLAIRQQMERTENGLVWNWSAFWLSIVWFLLKRMWGAAIAISVGFGLFILVFTEYILTGVLVPSWASTQATRASIGLLHIALVFGVPLFCGMFGNKLYVTYINARVRAMGLDPTPKSGI